MSRRCAPDWPTDDRRGQRDPPAQPALQARDFPERQARHSIGARRALAVVLETLVNPGRLDWATLAERMSHAPPGLAGLTTQGRPLAVGEPASLHLVDPAARAAVDRDASASIRPEQPVPRAGPAGLIVATMYAGRVTYRA